MGRAGKSKAAHRVDLAARSGALERSSASAASSPEPSSPCRIASSVTIDQLYTKALTCGANRRGCWDTRSAALEGARRQREARRYARETRMEAGRMAGVGGDVSSQYGGKDETCPVSTEGRGRGKRTSVRGRLRAAQARLPFACCILCLRSRADSSAPAMPASPSSARSFRSLLRGKRTFNDINQKLRRSVKLIHPPSKTQRTNAPRGVTQVGRAARGQQGCGR